MAALQPRGIADFLSGYATDDRIPPICFGKHPNQFGDLLWLTGGLTLLAPLAAVCSAVTVAAGDPVILLPRLLSVRQILADRRLVERPTGAKKPRQGLGRSTMAGFISTEIHTGVLEHPAERAGVLKSMIEARPPRP